MQTTNIWKKRWGRKNRSEKQRTSRILRRPQFKPRRRKPLSEIFEDNFLTNWIEQEASESASSNDWHLADRNGQITTNDRDEDSLQLDNLHYLSTMKDLLFLDLDNFSRFFQHLIKPLPTLTYIIAFRGSTNQWRPPTKSRDRFTSISNSRSIDFSSVISSTNTC